KTGSARVLPARTRKQRQPRDMEHARFRARCWKDPSGAESAVITETEVTGVTSSPLPLEPRAHRHVHILRDEIAIAIGVEADPSPPGLTQVTGAKPGQQRQVAFVPVAIGGFAPRGDLGRDVEEKRDVRLREKALNLEQPLSVEAVRFPIRDARGEI